MFGVPVSKTTLSLKNMAEKRLYIKRFVKNDYGATTMNDMSLIVKNDPVFKNMAVKRLYVKTCVKNDYGATTG